MRQDRFDALTRRLARGRSRREVLKLLGGGVVAGGFMAAAGAGSASAQQPDDALLTNGLTLAQARQALQPNAPQQICSHTRIPEGVCPSTFCSLTCPEGVLNAGFCVNPAQGNGNPTCAALVFCANSADCSNNSECRPTEFCATTCCSNPRKCVPRCTANA